MQNNVSFNQTGTGPVRPVPLTVALLTYNRAAMLKEAIAGILAQTWRDFEFLILDNGSTDDTPQVVLGVKDNRIRYVRNPPGSAVEFNGVSAFHIARGDRIIVTHDDDIMEPTMLERQMKLMDEHPEVLVVWTNVSMINYKGEQVQASASPCCGDRIFDRGEYILSFLSERLWPVPSSMMLVRELTPRSWVLEHYLGKKKRRKSKQGKNVAGTADVFLPAHFNTKGAVAYIGEPLLRYRLHPSQGTNSMDLSTPSIHLYNILGKLIRKTPFGAAYKSVFANYEVRFKTQRIISSIQTALPLRRDQRRLATLFERAIQHPQYVAEAGYPVLPLAILLAQLGVLPTSVLDRSLAPSDEYTTATRSYFRWFRHRCAGGNLFASWRGRRIVILGSALVSPLLILEAREAGCEVVCCIDSNIYRHDQHLLGLKIHPPGWLAQHREDFDTVVFSSEKDQEGYLADMVDMFAKGHVPSVSWKQIVAQATEGQGDR
ncbi:MAG: glycosyltransferase family 2 protein [Gammaproteobacteria bacterium]|nr:glycosyltransferase family 2 protein [Gammaproteobacteria bacterium]MBU1775283.1 glycosyltransferase family 2 protein [Gammaproteobacteria bacterium]MBU1968441.1 glycosyltransferase family 2 protein [Gammaproteobacteria bacterium]